MQRLETYYLLFQVANVQFIRMLVRRVSKINLRGRRQACGLFLKRVRCMHHEKDILLDRNLEAGAIKVRAAKCLCRRSVLAQLLKKQEHSLTLHHYLANHYVVYIHLSIVFSQEIGGCYVSHDIQYALIYKAYAIVRFERSQVAQQTLYGVFGVRFASHDCRRGLRGFAQFDCLS